MGVGPVPLHTGIHPAGMDVRPPSCEHRTCCCQRLGQTCGPIETPFPDAVILFFGPSVLQAPPTDGALGRRTVLHGLCGGARCVVHTCMHTVRTHQACGCASSPFLGWPRHTAAAVGGSLGLHCSGSTTSSFASLLLIWQRPTQTRRHPVPCPCAMKFCMSCGS